MLKVSDMDHHAMIDQIEVGDPAGAEAAMRAHLQTLERNTRRFLGLETAATVGGRT